MADLPGSIQYVKNCLAFLPHADLALLVVHADKGVEEFTRILHYFARHLQVPNIIPVINQPQADPETLELVLMELEELEGLEEVCLVENLKDQDQGLLALLETAERTIGEEPVREEGQFYMALEQVSILKYLSSIFRWGIYPVGEPFVLEEYYAVNSKWATRWRVFTRFAISLASSASTILSCSCLGFQCQRQCKRFGNLQKGNKRFTSWRPGRSFYQAET